MEKQRREKRSAQITGPISRTAQRTVMSAKRRLERSVEPVQRILYTREEAAAALGMSIDTFERKVQPFIRVVPCGALVQVPPEELRRWVRENARTLLRRAPDAA